MTFRIIDNLEGGCNNPLCKICLGKTLRITRVKGKWSQNLCDVKYQNHYELLCENVMAHIHRFLFICKLLNKKLMSCKICKHPVWHRYRVTEFYHRTERSILRREWDNRYFLSSHSVSLLVIETERVHHNKKLWHKYILYTCEECNLPLLYLPILCR